MKRSADNCPFYPACYVAGDCGRNRWQEADCGLPKAEQKKLRDKWMADLSLSVERNKIALRLAAEARAGKHDHLLPESAK
jgi:hypothetical protein